MTYAFFSNRATHLLSVDWDIQINMVIKVDWLFEAFLTNCSTFLVLICMNQSLEEFCENKKNRFVFDLIFKKRQLKQFHPWIWLTLNGLQSVSVYTKIPEFLYILQKDHFSLFPIQNLLFSMCQLKNKNYLENNYV